jgi:hypothetical protein
MKMGRKHEYEHGLMMGFLVRQSIVYPFHIIIQKPTMELNSG